MVEVIGEGNEVGDEDETLSPVEDQPDGEDTSFDFGIALRMLKDGKNLARKGWNGKDMFIFYRPCAGSERFREEAHLCMRNAQGKIVVGWLASQTDMLAEDWFEAKTG